MQACDEDDRKFHFGDGEARAHLEFQFGWGIFS